MTKHFSKFSGVPDVLAARFLGAAFFAGAFLAPPFLTTAFFATAMTYSAPGLLADRQPS
jgi:hypothetical protein